MKSRWLGGAVLVAMWGYALAVFTRLPAEIPTHWGLDGQVDGWSPRWPGAFIAPGVATLVFALIQAMPRIDPRRRNVERSGENRLLMANLIVLFLGLLEVLTLGVALGWPVDVSTGITVGLGLLLIGMGNYLPRIRSNWWIGIRTPWTLDSERVWRDTHRVGGRAFVIGGLVLLLVPLVPGAVRHPLTLSVLILIAAVPLGYSFIAWKREASGHSE
jgi:uncharacterized membrane protein